MCWWVQSHIFVAHRTKCVALDFDKRTCISKTENSENRQTKEPKINVCSAHTQNEQIDNGSLSIVLRIVVDYFVCVFRESVKERGRQRQPDSSLSSLFLHFILVFQWSDPKSMRFAAKVGNALEH